MNWRHEWEERERKVDALYNKIKKIEREIKEVGSTDPLQIIKESMDNDYDEQVRVRNDTSVGLHRLVLFPCNATKKQVQYGRNEIGFITVRRSLTGIEVYNGKDFVPTDLPDTTEEIYDLIINKSKHKM